MSTTDTDRRVMASGTNRQTARACMWCGKGMSRSDRVRLALGAEKVIDGLHPVCSIPWMAAAGVVER